MRQQPSAVNRRVHAQQDRHLDCARGVKPALGVASEAGVRFRVVNGDGQGAGASRPFELVETEAQCVERVGAERERCLNFTRGHCAVCRGKRDAWCLLIQLTAVESALRLAYNAACRTTTIARSNGSICFATCRNESATPRRWKSIRGTCPASASTSACGARAGPTAFA